LAAAMGAAKRLLSAVSVAAGALPAAHILPWVWAGAGKTPNKAKTLKKLADF